MMGGGKGNSAGKLFLGGVSPNTQKEHLEAHFSRFGNVIDAVVMYKDGKHRGFGFVTFDTEEAADLALVEPNELDGRVIDAKKAAPPGEAPPPKGFAPQAEVRTDKVFVGGLPQDCQESSLREYFGNFGTIVDAVVMTDRDTGKTRGFGFVRFDSPEPVDIVMANAANHQICGKQIECKKAVPQGKGDKGAGKGYASYGGGGYGGYGGYGGNGGYGSYGGGYGKATGKGGWGAPAATSYGAGPYGAASWMGKGAGGGGAPPAVWSGGGYGMGGGGGYASYGSYAAPGGKGGSPSFHSFY